MNSKSYPVAICDNCGRYLHFCFCTQCAKNCTCAFCCKNSNPEPKPIKNIVVERFHESNLLEIYTADQPIRTKVLNVIHKYGEVINTSKKATLRVSPCWDVNTVMQYIENLA